MIKSWGKQIVVGEICVNNACGWVSMKSYYKNGLSLLWFRFFRDENAWMKLSSICASLPPTSVRNSIFTPLAQCIYITFLRIFDTSQSQRSAEVIWLYMDRSILFLSWRFVNTISSFGLEWQLCLHTRNPVNEIQYWYHHMSHLTATYS